MPNPELINSSVKVNPGAQPVQQPGLQISCCAFNADGSIFVTGSSDKYARVWDARKWNDEITGKPNHEMDILKGHENAVNYVQFCGRAGPVRLNTLEGKEDGTTRFKNAWPTRDSIVTCSRDGSAIIWICRPHKKIARYSHWSKAYHLRVPPPPMPPHPPRVGGPRQRFLPTPRGVNMIVWSLDNRFVLAAIMDCRICVWNAVDGSLVHSLTGHTKSTFVVDVHPFNPRIAMSAGYDGRVIIWDIWEGHPVRVYETGDFQIVDGSFSPDGTSIVVSDEVGQFYLLTTGQGQSQKDAKYDQFFLGDFRPLVRDLQGNVLDQETQLPPHQRNIQDLLCDANMIPYQEPYQSLYQRRRLGALGIDWQPLRLNLAVGMDDLNPVPFRDHPFVFHPNIPGSSIETADDGTQRWVEQPIDVDDEVDWEQDLTKLSEDSESEYSVSEEILSLLGDEDERTASSSEGLMHTNDYEDGGEESVHETRLRRSNRHKRKAEGFMDEHAEKKTRKVSSSLPQADISSACEVHKANRQGQSDLVKTSSRLASRQSMTRPKRAAAANALQLFSSKQEMEDEEDDDVSSSHQDTSLYNDDDEAESDGMPWSSGRNDGGGTSQVKEIDTIMGVSDTKEASQRSATEDIEESDGAEINDAQQEDSEWHIGKFENAAAVEDGRKRVHDASSSFDQEDKCIKRGPKDVGIKDSVPGENLAPGAQDLPDIGEPNKQPRSQRRLVLKLRNYETDTAGTSNKAELEDPHNMAETTSPKVNNLDISKQQTRRRLRRLIIKAPDSATHAEGNSGGLSDTWYESLSMPHHGKTASLGRPRKRLKGKSPCAFNRVLKSEENEAETFPSEPSEGNPSSTSGSYSRPVRVIPSLTRKGRGKIASDAVAEVGSKRMAVSRGLEIRQTHLGRFDGDPDVELSLQRISSPGLSSVFPASSQCHTSDENASLGSEPDEADARLCDAYHGCSGVNYGKLMNEDEGQQQNVGKFSNELIASQGGKNREKVAHTSDSFGCLKFSKKRTYLNDTFEDLGQSSGHSSCAREIDSDEDSIKHGLGVRESLEDMDELEESENGGQFDIIFGDGDASWNRSKNMGVKIDVLQHKKRNLCELESAKPLSYKIEEGSAGRKRVSQMYSAKSDHVGMMKGNKAKRDTVKEERELPSNEANSKRVGKRAKKVPASYVYQADDATVDVHPPFAESHELHGIRPRTRGLGRNEQAETSSVMHGQTDTPSTKKRKDLRASSRIRREILKIQDKDQTQHNDMSVMREKGTRTRKSLAWLLQSEVEENRYIPQYGDEVVYLRQGHAEYLDMYKRDESGPWSIYGTDLSHTEICQVVGLDYMILPDTGETCCRFTLEFVGCKSYLQGKRFSLSLPELINFPDFIVEKSRYDASMARKWTYRDRCKVWWRSQNEQGGSWWDGRVIAVKPKSIEFQESPWERFLVQYKSDPTKPYSHSPWELFDPGDTKWEQPHITWQMREHLLLLLRSAANDSEDMYGLQKLKQVSCKTDYINRLPLPLTPDVLLQRLDKDYYHSTRALSFDVQLLAENAECYWGSEHQGLRAFVRKFHAEIFGDSSFT
ncbi:hypothetical protein KP509_1Z073200 [Ceratopteris richardii]|nr:hypothetical protein KP509_1Z073200 [Ceratopteris richardii]